MPNARLVRQSNPVWNREFLAHVSTHRVCYPGVDQAGVDRVDAELSGGIQSQRNNAAECFEIVIDDPLPNTVIGELCVTKPFVCPLTSVYTKEVSMTVFDSHSGSGFGRQALDAYLKATTVWPVDCVVQAANPRAADIERFLLSLGFVRINPAGSKKVIVRMSTAPAPSPPPLPATGS